MGIQNLLIVSATALLVACGGGSGGDGGSGGGGSPTPAKFSVAVAPASVTVGQGQEVAVEIVIVRDAGFTEPISVTLNQPAAGITADTLLLSGSRDRGFLPIRVAPDLAAGSVHRLDVMGTAGGAAQVVSSNLTVSAPQPYTSKKIATALNAGTLDYETSLLYRAYAFFEDKRLPEAYLGAGTVEDDNLIFDEIRAGFANLSITAQDALRPFIVRPADARSVWNTAVSANKVQATSLKKAFPVASTEACPVGEAGSWISKRSLSYPVRVWAQCRGEVVNDSENVMLIDKTLAVLNKIYAPMTGLMGEPRPDVEGDDNAIDVYILNDDSYVHRRDNDIAQKQGATAHSDDAQTPVGKGASGFITVARTLLYNQRFNITMIHELFHVLQFAHNAEFSIRPIAGTTKTERHWFSEASASWAAAHFDRTLAPWDDGRAAWIDVHRMFTQFFLPSFEALNTIGGPHPYSAYIWPYFVEQEKNGPGFMGQIWVGLETVTTFEQADDVIDANYPFAENFKTFALRNLNNEFAPGDPLPYAKRYVNQDPEKFPDRIAPDFVNGKKPFELVADQEFRQSLDIENLSARYLQFSPNGLVRKVEFDFSGLQPQDLTDVQALIRTTDGWVAQPFDYSTTNTVTFCFTEGPTTATRNGSFVEMILVVSNHAKREGNKVTGTLIVKPQTKPCSLAWKGRSSYTVDDGFSTKYTIVADVTFEFDDTAPQTAGIPYRVRSGNLSFELKSGSACVLTRTAGGPMLKVPFDINVVGSTNARLWIHPTSPFLAATYSGEGATVVTTTETDCAGGVTHDTTVIGWLGIGSPQRVSDDGNTLQGVYQSTDAPGTNRHEWLFTKTLE
jgi:hypothetical protein